MDITYQQITTLAKIPYGGKQSWVVPAKGGLDPSLGIKRLGSYSLVYVIKQAKLYAARKELHIRLQVNK